MLTLNRLITFLASETRLYDFWFEFCSFETVEVKLKVQTWSFKQPSMALWSFDLKAKEIYFSKSFKLLTFFVENLIISSKQEKLDLKSFNFSNFIVIHFWNFILSQIYFFSFLSQSLDTSSDVKVSASFMNSFLSQLLF